MEFVVAFTVAHDCWLWPTWKVVNDIITPATAHLRCRYADLPECASHVGAATIFGSHCWGARWGDLVAALGCGAHPGRCVWLDVFAVRQWPGNGADLDFTGIVRRCDAFILATASLPDVADLAGLDIAFGRTTASEGDRKMLSFFRVWCLVEIGAALAHSKPVLMKAGSHVKDGDTVRFEPNHAMLGKMLLMVNVLEAQATVPADRDRILRDVQAAEGGAAALDSLVKGAITGAMAMHELEMPEVEAAACGEMEGLMVLPEEQMQNVMHAAAGGGFVAIIHHALAHGAAVNAEVRDQTALSWAASGGHLAAVEVLVAAGAEVNAQTTQTRRMTTLMNAAFVGHQSVIEALVDAGAEVNAELNDGFTALMWAAMSGHQSAVAALIAAKAEVNAQTNAGGTNWPVGNTVLMAAALGGHHWTVEVLVAAKAEVHTRDNDGNTALMKAASGGPSAVDALVAANADVNAQCKDTGFTALMNAASKGHQSAVKVLITARAEVNKQNELGSTALILAARDGSGGGCESKVEAYMATVEALVAARADVNAQDSAALISAALKGNQPMVQTLVAAGAEVNTEGRGGFTALMQAARAGHQSTVEALVEARADLDTRRYGDHDGDTAIMLAASQGHQSVVEALSAAGETAVQASAAAVPVPAPASGAGGELIGLFDKLKAVHEAVRVMEDWGVECAEDLRLLEQAAVTQLSGFLKKVQQKKLLMLLGCDGN